MATPLKIVGRFRSKSTGEYATNQFTQTCKFVIRLIQEYNEKVNENRDDAKVTLVSNESEMTEIFRQLCDGHIPISVLGRHKAGKSTLINAMIGDKLMPTGTLNETAVRVYIQHTPDCHHGLCPSQKGHCDKCPRLIPFSSKISKSIVAPTKSEHTDVHDPELKGSEKEREGYSKLVAKGAKGIVHMLREANKLVRSAGNHSGVVEYYLVKANLPAFGDVPSGLKVMLVDVPGLGDGNMSITQVALESAKISSAYIYLCHYQHFDDSSDFDAIGLLHQKDKDLFSSGRLLIVVSQFDHYYTAIDDADAVTEDHVCEVICARIKERFDADFSSENIVFVSGDWAQHARIYLNLDDTTKQQLYYRIMSGKRICDSDRKLPDDVILLKASRIEEFEDKIRDLLPSCFEHWIQSMKCTVSGFVDIAISELEKCAELHCNKGTLLQKKYDGLTEWKEKIDVHHQQIELTKGGKGTNLYKCLLENYDDDIQTAQQLARDAVSSAYGVFLEMCSSKVSGPGGYTLVDFKQDIVQFLENVSSLVGDLFDNAYFQEINWTLNNAYLVLGQHHGQLTSAAEAFCTHGGTPEAKFNTKDIQLTIEGLLKDSPPQLMKLRARVKISEFEPRGLFARFRKFLRKGWKSVVRIVFTRVIPQERSGYSEPAPKRIEVFPAEEEKPDSQTNDTETSEKKDATDPEDLHLSQKQITEGIGSWKEELLEEITIYSSEVKTEIVEHFNRIYVRRVDELLQLYRDHFKTKVRDQVKKTNDTKQHFEREIKHGQLLRQLKDNLLQNRERLYMEAEVLHKDIVANKTTY